MISLRSRPLVASLLALLTAGSAARAQDCAGLPAIEPPKLEKCGGGLKRFVQELTGTGCAGRNERAKLSYEHLTRGFANGVEYSSGQYYLSHLADSARAITVDSLRGCRGENINLELTPGNVSYFEYELVAPSNVIVAKGTYSTWSGDKILGDNLTLPETGYYILKTRTTAPPKTETRKAKDGRVYYETRFPRAFRVSFRSDASVAALGAGDKVDATVNAKQPFIRRVTVKGGTKVRFRFASMGTGDFLVLVMRETGEELYRNSTPTSYYESQAFTPKSDETFRVEVRPWAATQSVGVQFSVVDDKATGESVTATSRIVSAFKLPANFDAKTNSRIATSETSRLVFNAERSQGLALTVRPSQIAGLHMRIRVYNEESEELALKPTVVSSPTTLSFTLSQAGTWIIELMPVSAPEMQEDGEAKYTIEFAPRAADQAPARRTQGSGGPSTR